MLTYRFVQRLLKHCEVVDGYVRECGGDASTATVNDMIRDACLWRMRQVADIVCRLPDWFKQEVERSEKIDWVKIGDECRAVVDADGVVDEDVFWRVVKGVLPELSEALRRLKLVPEGVEFQDAVDEGRRRDTSARLFAVFKAVKAGEPGYDEETWRENAPAFLKRAVQELSPLTQYGRNETVKQWMEDDVLVILIGKNIHEYNLNLSIDHGQA